MYAVECLSKAVVIVIRAVNKSALDTLFRPEDHMRRRRVWAGTMELGDWLRSLGLERYEPAFRENAIDTRSCRD